MVNSDTIGYLLWGCLVVSIALTVLGVIRKSIRLLLVAAILSLVFGIEGLWSVGLFGLLLTCLQLAMVAGYALKVRPLGWVLLFLLALTFWVVIAAYVGNPFGWKTVGTL